MPYRGINADADVTDEELATETNNSVTEELQWKPCPVVLTQANLSLPWIALSF